MRDFFRLLVVSSLLSFGLPLYSEEAKVHELIKHLSGTVEAADRAKALLVKLGDQAVPPLVEALHSRDKTTKYNAASALGLIGDARAIPALARMGEADDYSTRVALLAICQVGGTDAATYLIKSLTKRPRHVEVISALGSIGDNRAIGPLIEILGSDPRSDELKPERIEAAKALGRFRDPRARNALKKAIADEPYWDVYRAAKVALSALEGHQGAYEYYSVPLTELSKTAVMKEPDPPEGAEEHVRREQERRRRLEEEAKAAGELPLFQSFGPQVQMFASATDINRARGLLLKTAVRPQATEEVVEVLMEYLRNRKINDSVRERAVRVIVQIGRPAVPFVLNGLKRGDTVLKANCAKCLAEIGDDAAVKPLEEYADTLTGSQRDAVQELIGKLKAKQGK